MLNKNVNFLNASIEELLAEIESIENKKDLNEVKKVRNINIENKLNVEGTIIGKEIISDEMKLGGIKISNNYMHVDDQFKMVYKNQALPLSELINFNQKVKMMKKNCGKNLDCFVNKSYMEEKRQKDDMIRKSLENIKGHLDSLKK